MEKKYVVTLCDEDSGRPLDPDLELTLKTDGELRELLRSQEYCGNLYSIHTIINGELEKCYYSTDWKPGIGTIYYVSDWRGSIVMTEFANDMEGEY